VHLAGNLAEASRTPQRHRVILDWANRFGLLYHVRLAWVDVVIISDPAVAAEVLHSRKFDKGAPARSRLDLLGMSDWSCRDADDCMHLQGC